MLPGDIIRKALAEDCMGIMFCFNEPTVSYFTFLKLAEEAKESGLLVGFSTNGYMTRQALEGLIPLTDFVNFGLKGASEKSYGPCGVENIAPVWRNLTTLHEKGIYLEVSIVFRKHEEAEVLDAAAFVASLSRDIPLQVMRFIPFGDASAETEPSVREAEKLCIQLREKLNYVYLFNSPGTDFLNSICPRCGTKIMERGFFGPMASNLFRWLPEGRCSCGFQLPIRGHIHDSNVMEQGYFGGYKTINALNMIRAILDLLGVTDKDSVDDVIRRVIREDYVKDLYDRLNGIDAYLNTVNYFASITGCEEKARLYAEYTSSRVGLIKSRVEGAEKPGVFCSLSHPLISVFEDKMEACLVETAGGGLTNRLIKKDRKPGITISPEQFCQMAPEIIFISGFNAWPVDDFTSFCTEKGMDVPAVRNGRIYNLYPFRSSTGPDWILGLMNCANIIHPHIFNFDLESEADSYYREFYGVPFREVNGRYSPRARFRKRMEAAQALNN
jgi:pyruvate-formate lyase-activating enzyme